MNVNFSFEINLFHFSFLTSDFSSFCFQCILGKGREIKNIRFYISTSNLWERALENNCFFTFLHRSMVNAHVSVRILQDLLKIKKNNVELNWGKSFV